jgi:hypothetical protein
MTNLPSLYGPRFTALGRSSKFSIWRFAGGTRSWLQGCFAASTLGAFGFTLPNRLIRTGVFPPREVGLLRCASSRCQTPSVSPLQGHYPANPVRPALSAETRSGPFPCPGIACLVSFTLRVNEARLANWSACRSPAAAKTPAATDQASGAIAPGSLQPQHHLAGGVGLHAVACQRGPGDVAAQLFQRLADVSAAAHDGVQAQPVDVGPQRLHKFFLPRQRALHRQHLLASARALGNAIGTSCGLQRP